MHARKEVQDLFNYQKNHQKFMKRKWLIKYDIAAHKFIYRPMEIQKYSPEVSMKEKHAVSPELPE